MKNILVLVLLTFTLSLCGQKSSNAFVTRVVDGDTYVIQVNSYRGKETTLIVRLVNVDTPEIQFIPKRRPAQAYGHQAKDSVEALILNKQVGLLYYGKDRYNRVLAFVNINGERLDEIILKRGWGWSSWEYHNQKQHKVGKVLEAKAREQKIGLWINPGAIHPYIYRTTD